MKIYAATYTPCIYESNYSTISLHKTIKGAKKAIKEHKNIIKKECMEVFSYAKPDPDMIFKVKWDAYKNWKIIEKEIKE